MQTDERQRLCEILIVEDSPLDVRLMREAMRNWVQPHQLHVVVNGVEALDFLYQRSPYTQVPRPDLVLLDLNLPRRNGHDVLRQIKADEALLSIPVIVFSSSNAKVDVHTAYQLRANGYITKGITLESMFQAVAAIESFWLRCAKLPN